MDKKSRELVMGKLFLKNKDFKMAEKSLVEYLSSHPDDYQALKMLAQVQEHLNDTSKAFDLYQRCYLAQPDRKGVLLDICRLLLTRSPSLDHVDQRKWLKLAAQSFPTNPIITNLRECLPEGQGCKTTLDSADDVVLNKLTSIESRLQTIEDLIKRLEGALKAQPPKQEQMTKEQVLKAQSPKQEQVKKEQAPKANGGPSILGKPKSENSFTFTGVNLFAENLAKPNMPAESAKTSAPKVDTSVNLFAESLAKLKIPAESAWTSAPKVDTGVNLFAGSLAKLNTPAESAWTSAPKVDTGVNLFAESLAKLNMPAEGAWTSAPKVDKEKPKRDEGKGEEYDGDDNDSEVVNDEELPIENFCDMKPIEIKTGEEDEDKVFEYRCKLYRFRDKEYKERGLGAIKVLKHKETGKGRLIMRRDLINLVCLNCWSCTSIERVRDNQVRFAGLDASDGEATMTVFLAKFKTQETTDEFEKHLRELFAEE